MYALALEDLTEAAALFRPAWEQPRAWMATNRRKSHPMSPTTPRRRSRSPGGCTTRPTSPTCWSTSSARRRDPPPPMAAALGPALAGARRGRRPSAAGSVRIHLDQEPDLPDTYYRGRLVALKTIDTIPEKTLLAFADHGSLEPAGAPLRIGDGPSQRPPAPALTPMPSLSISSATEQAHSPRTGPRCSRRSKKRRRSSRPKAA